MEKVVRDASAQSCYTVLYSERDKLISVVQANTGYHHGAPNNAYYILPHRLVVRIE
jgi:hypothetical protein